MSSPMRNPPRQPETLSGQFLSRTPSNHSHHHHKHGHSNGRNSGSFSAVEPVLQIICVGSGGGPSEDNVTAFLARSISTNWSKGSVLALDAGSHLGALTRMLEKDFPAYSRPKKAVPAARGAAGGRVNGTAAAAIIASEDYEMTDSSCFTTPEPEFTMLRSGPFAGLAFPHESARANALHIVHECVSTYLISHPHLDHLSAFAINTAAFHNTSRPKRLAALPSTVNAIKTHIFNDVIWPNLTDEDGGVGFVTFQRLAQGGNIAVGSGPGTGYMEVCDGLCVKGMKVSHGRCIPGPISAMQRGHDLGLSEATVPPQHDDSPAALNRRMSFALVPPGMGGMGAHMGHMGAMTPNPSASPPPHVHRDAVVDSTAFFVREDRTGREILFFGDVEPDSISLNPRTAHVWAEAAPKIASGKLKAIFIECSYEDVQGDNVLFGHMAPRHLFKELQNLADLVGPKKTEQRERRESRKRKREELGLARQRTASLEDSSIAMQPDEDIPVTTPGLKKRISGTVSTLRSIEEATSPMTTSAPKAIPISSRVSAAAPDKPTIVFTESANPFTPGSAANLASSMNSIAVDTEREREPPLAGLTIVVIHVKDTMRDDVVVGDRILEQLLQHEADLVEEEGVGLGCKFVVSKTGEDYVF